MQNDLRPLLLRRVKEDVEKSIPPKEETIVYVEMTNLQKTFYRAVYEKVSIVQDARGAIELARPLRHASRAQNRHFLGRGVAVPMSNLRNIEMELRKCCNHPFLLNGVEASETHGMR